MKELLRKSEHQPEEIVTVRDDKVEALMATGNYSEIKEDFTPSKNVHNKEDVFFSDSMTEKEIKKKIEKYKIGINYDISNDNKKDILKKLKGLNYNVE